MRAEVAYTALVSVTVDVETGAVASVGIHAPGDEDETPFEVSVSLESETDEPDGHVAAARPQYRFCGFGHRRPE